MPRRDQYRMTTAFGKRRGWEIQKLRLQDGHIYYRLTHMDSCMPASDAEVVLWRVAKLPFGTDGDMGGK